MNYLWKDFLTVVSHELGNIPNVLDVGCRDEKLKKYLFTTEYTGCDKFPVTKDTLYCDLEQPSGLTHFGERRFHTVTAFDVLEHTDNMSSSFKRLHAVANKKIAITLPNQYHWRLRLQYLRGVEMGKYAFRGIHYNYDRHKWLLSYDGGLRFAKLMADTHNCYLDIVPFFQRNLPDSMLPLNLGVWATLYIFTRRD